MTKTPVTTITLTPNQVGLLLQGLELLEARDTDAAASDESYRQLTHYQRSVIVITRLKLKTTNWKLVPSVKPARKRGMQ